jgi:methionyl-tRNA formyltransferase
MKMLLLAEEDLFFLPNLTAKLASKGLLIGIIIVKEKRPFDAHLKQIILLAKILGLNLFRLLFDMMLAKASDLIFKKKYYSLKKVAQNYSLPIYYLENLYGSEFDEIIKKSNTNVVFTQVSKKLTPGLLKKAIFINKHCSLLPKYAGLYPVFWSMINGESSLGISIHQMDQDYDSGCIFCQEKISISNHTFFSAYHALYDICYYLLMKYSDSPTVKKGQNYLERTYYSYPSYKERRKFYKLGFRYGSAFRLHKDIL